MADKELNMVDHLDELRKRLIISAIAFILFFMIAFIFVEEIYQWLVRDLDMKLIVLGPTDILWIYFIIAGVIAIAASIPVITFQVWSFVKPGLLPHERKTTLQYIPALFLLFILGICFGYYVIFPTVLTFLIGLGGEMFMTSFTAEKYFRFLINMTLPFAFLFELPAIAMFLTSIGILNPYGLAKVRKYAYFILVVIAVLLSPPDFISDILVAIPLLLLYEISISLSKFVYKRRQKRLENSEEDEYDKEEWA